MNTAAEQTNQTQAQSAPLTKDINALSAQCNEHKQPMRFFAQAVRVERKETKGRPPKPYFDVEFADAAGTVKLKAWSDAPGFGWAEVTAVAMRPSGAREGMTTKAAVKDALSAITGGVFVVEVSGTFSKGDYGVESGDWTVRALTEEERAGFFLGSVEVRAKQERDWRDINDMVSCHLDLRITGMRDGHFRTLCETFLRERGNEFRRAAAARGNHHARPGGLVEHVAGMMRSAMALCPQYDTTLSGHDFRDPHSANVAPRIINRDLLLAGVLFHDCGKLWENQYRADSFEMPFSQSGEMLGHIPIGDELVRNLWAECEAGDIAAGGDAWPGDKLLHLRHLILSHHGTKEWGSPVEPKTYEAVLLHHIDNLDAKMEMMLAAREKVAEIAPGIIGKSWPIGTSVVTPRWEVAR